MFKASRLSYKHRDFISNPHLLYSELSARLIKLQIIGFSVCKFSDKIPSRIRMHLCQKQTTISKCVKVGVEVSNGRNTFVFRDRILNNL